MKYDHPEIIEPALEIIKNTEPELHAAMMASDWDVHVVTDVDTDGMRLNVPGMMPERMQLATTPGIEAMTSIRPPRQTDIIYQAFQAHAPEYGAPVSHEMAVNLAHEFAHHKGLNEIGGYAAGLDVAEKLQDGNLAQNQAAGLIEALTGQL